MSGKKNPKTYQDSKLPSDIKKKVWVDEYRRPILAKPIYTDPKEHLSQARSIGWEIYSMGQSAGFMR